MQGQFRRYSPGHGENGRIGHDQTIWPYGFELMKIGLYGHQFTGPGKDVYRYISLCAIRMCQIKRGLDFFKAEVIGKVSQAKLIARQVDGIGAVVQHDFKLFKITGRRQEFNFFSIVRIHDVSIPGHHIVETIQRVHQILE